MNLVIRYLILLCHCDFSFFVGLAIAVAIEEFMQLPPESIMFSIASYITIATAVTELINCYLLTVVS